MSNLVKLIALAAGVSLAWVAGCTKADIDSIDYSSGTDAQISSSSEGNNANAKNDCIKDELKIKVNTLNDIVAACGARKGEVLALLEDDVGSCDKNGLSFDMTIGEILSECGGSEIPVVIVSSSSGGNSSSSVGGSSSSVSSSSVILGNCVTGELEDTRDGNCYKTETYGGRVWMSENLNYSKGGTLGYCYKMGAEQNERGIAGEDGPGCDRPYGRIYNWVTAMDGTSSQGLCPNGWHIPSPTEWNSIRVGGTMSNGFYVYAGNFNVNSEWPPLGWKDRIGDVSLSSDARGYYWTNEGNSIEVTFAIMTPSYYVNTATDPAMPIDDHYSVRCIKDVTPSSSSTPGSSSSGNQNPSSNSSVTFGSATEPVSSIDARERFTLRNGECIDIIVHWIGNPGSPMNLQCAATTSSNNWAAQFSISIRGGTQSLCGPSSFNLPCSLGTLNDGRNEWGICVTADDAIDFIECQVHN